MIALLCSLPLRAQPTSRPSLAEAYKGDFLIGVATDFTTYAPLSPEDLSLIKHQFNAITPENSMKPQSVHPEENRWNWDGADKLVDFCQANKIQLFGHCLVWHAQTAQWFFTDDNGQPAPRQTVLERMRQHIQTEVSRYKGKVKGWDVVNEAISDRGSGDTENLRESPWLRAIGPEYIADAFKFAHEADPNAELYYNDYSIEKGNKHQSSLLLLKRLISQGVPLTAVGIQGHWSLKYLPFDDLEKAIDDYHALGLKVNITELDITISGKGGGQLTPTTGSSTRASTTDQLDAQAQAYARFFKIFQKHRDAIDRVTFWGVNDGRSWRRGQSPLLFDANNQPKPAFNAVIAAKE